MIDTPGLSINFLKKENYTGSHSGMRYYLCKNEDILKFCVYPEPYCFEATPDSEKTWKEFTFSSEGLKEGIQWMNTMYNERFKQ